MKIVLLCAGYATRLYPLTENTPKPLLPVGGKPMLEWILDRVKELKGVEAAYIISNHKFAGHFEEWTKKVKYPWPVEVVDDRTTSNETRLGAIGDLAYCLKQKKVGIEDILVIAGDNLFSFDLVQFVETGRAKKHAAIAVYDVKDKELAKQYGLVRPDADGKVLEFLEKPQNPPTTLASCGLYWLPSQTRLLLDRYIADGHNPDQPGHYMRWLAETAGLYAVTLKGTWLDIGDRASYDKANAQYQQQKVTS
jgi:glucose-1-phosphate thymidylyltransferase